MRLFSGYHHPSQIIDRSGRWFTFPWSPACRAFVLSATAQPHAGTAFQTKPFAVSCVYLLGVLSWRLLYRLPLLGIYRFETNPLALALNPIILNCAMIRVLHQALITMQQEQFSSCFCSISGVLPAPSRVSLPAFCPASSSVLVEWGRHSYTGVWQQEYLHVQDLATLLIQRQLKMPGTEIVKHSIFQAAFQRVMWLNLLILVTTL